MTMISIAGLVAAMLVLAITPGPGVFATISKSLATGFRQTLPLVAGIVVGDLIFLLFAVLGLAAIAEMFSSLFLLVKYLGATYLIWLGVRLWRSSPESHAKSKLTDSSHKSSFFAGLSITLGNPKVVLFYLGFLPTFVDLARLSPADVLLVALVVSSVLGAVMLAYAWSASRARHWLATPIARKRLNRSAGTIMAGTGVALLAKAE